MRLGGASNDAVRDLAARADRISAAYLEGVGRHTAASGLKVMLADCTVIDQQTFEPERVRGYYEGIVGRLDGWDARDVSVSGDGDLRRIFTKFGVREGNYLLSGHMATQFHVLLYYRPDSRVAECQKELAALADGARADRENAAGTGDRLVLERLQKLGHGRLDPQSLFELFYRDEKLGEEMERELEAHSGRESDSGQKESRLLAELDGYLMETYHTSHVLLDDTRLVAGEEGSLCTFELEYVGGGSRQGAFDPRRIPDDVCGAIAGRLDEFAAGL